MNNSNYENAITTRFLTLREFAVDHWRFAAFYVVGSITADAHY